MFYWLFTEGRTLLGGCLAPLLCLTLMVSAMLGAGIQRTSETQGQRAGSAARNSLLT
ncbi:MAG: hypothetical protein OHK0023_14160 [Anaerolineae bacterium]